MGKLQVVTFIVAIGAFGLAPLPVLAKVTCPKWSGKRHRA